MTRTVLEARGLVYAYRGGPPVLDGATLAIRTGRRLAVLGPNGGGKTTLFRLLLGLLVPARGEVLLDGRPLDRSRRGLARLRQAAQLVLQDPDDQLFAADVAQDVSFGPLNLDLPTSEVDVRVADALAAMGITDLADRPTHQLSFGQRKRVAIAGALAVRPRVLVLDEPTAGLDPAGVEELVAILGRLHDAGTAIVLSTHDVDLAYRWADDIAVVGNRQVRRAPALEILDDPQLLAEARLGPAWGPGVAQLLALAGHAGAAPRTAAELHQLLATLASPAPAAASPHVRSGRLAPALPGAGTLGERGHCGDSRSDPARAIEFAARRRTTQPVDAQRRREPIEAGDEDAS